LQGIVKTENDKTSTSLTEDLSPFKSSIRFSKSAIERRPTEVSPAASKKGGAITDEEVKKTLEEDLLGLVGRMKSYARNYKEQLTRDKHVSDAHH
jgi:hypothetical protein